MSFIKVIDRNRERESIKYISATRIIDISEHKGSWKITYLATNDLRLTGYLGDNWEDELNTVGKVLDLSK